MAARAGAALEAASSVRPTHRRSGGRVALLLAAVAGVVACGPWGLSDNAQALTIPRLKKDKVLFTKQGYELRLQPRRTKSPIGKVIPKVVFRKVPPTPIKISALGGSVDSDLDKEMMGFPFTTSNTGSLSIGFPRINGELKVSAKDPPVSAELEDATKSGEVSWTNSNIPGVGNLGFKLKSNGEWGTSWDRDVEDIGHLRASVNSALDWSVDLDTTYPEVKGISPSVSYGATQDGMRLRASATGETAQGVSGSYQIQNLPGKYAPVDFIHDASVALTKGGNSIEAEGQFDRRLPKRPVRGSLSLVARTRPMTMKASVDFDRYRLVAGNKFAQVSAAAALKADAKDTGLLGGRPVELGLKLGPVSGEARLKGTEKPRVKLELDV